MLQELDPLPRPRDVAADPVTVVALGRALELLEYVIRQTPPDRIRTRDRADCPALVGVDTAALLPLRCVSVRELYANGMLPVQLTLGADIGRPGTEVRSSAARLGRRVTTASGGCLLTDLHPHLTDSQSQVRTS